MRGEEGCPVPCSRAPRHGPGGELGPLQITVHTPHLGLVGDLNQRPYSSLSKPLLTSSSIVSHHFLMIIRQHKSAKLLNGEYTDFLVYALMKAHKEEQRLYHFSCQHTGQIYLFLAVAMEATETEQP